MRIEQDMTIYTAAELKAKLLAALAEPGAPVLDLSGVGEIDGAGVQLLLLARREARQSGRKLRIVGDSAPVTEVLSLVGFRLGAGESDQNPEGADA